MRGDLSTIIGSKVNTAVKVSGIFVPANSVSSTLQLFTDPGLYHAHGLPNYALSKSGSLVRVKIRDRYFVITSHHQSKRPGYGLDELVLHIENRTKLITGHRAIFPEDKEGEYNFDCLLYEFTDVVKNGNLPKSNWYRLTESDLTQPTPKPLIVCAIGYPSFRNSIEYENDTYAIGPNAVWGKEI